MPFQCFLRPHHIIYSAERGKKYRKSIKATLPDSDVISLPTASFLYQTTSISTLLPPCDVTKATPIPHTSMTSPKQCPLPLWRPIHRLYDITTALRRQQSHTHCIITHHTHWRHYWKLNHYSDIVKATPIALSLTTPTDVTIKNWITPLTSLKPHPLHYHSPHPLTSLLGTKSLLWHR